MSGPTLIEDGVVIQTDKARYVFPDLPYLSQSARMAIVLILASSQIHVSNAASTVELLRAVARHPHGDHMLRALAVFFPAAIVYPDGRIELLGNGWESTSSTIHYQRKFPGVNSTNLPYKFWGR